MRSTLTIVIGSGPDAVSRSGGLRAWRG